MPGATFCFERNGAAQSERASPNGCSWFERVKLVMQMQTFELFGRSVETWVSINLSCVCQPATFLERRHGGCSVFSPSQGPGSSKLGVPRQRCHKITEGSRNPPYRSNMDHFPNTQANSCHHWDMCVNKLVQQAEAAQRRPNFSSMRKGQVSSPWPATCKLTGFRGAPRQKRQGLE